MYIHTYVYGFMEYGMYPRYQTSTIAAMHVATTPMELESKLIIKDKTHITMVTQYRGNTFITMATQHTQVVC